MAERVRIRTCRLDDCAAIATIYNASVRMGGATFDREPKSATHFRTLIAGFGKRETILVLEQGAELLGWGIIKQYSDRLAYRVTCETSVYLRHDCLRRGWGTRLKKAIIAQCRHFRYHHLVAKIAAENHASIAYNRKLGYEMVGTQKQVGYYDGSWRDVVIMQLVLADVAPYLPEESSI